MVMLNLSDLTILTKDVLSDWIKQKSRANLFAAKRKLDLNVS